MATRDSGADDADMESGSERLDPKDQASPALLRERVISVLKEAAGAIPYTQLFAAAVRPCVMPPAHLADTSQGYSKASVRFADGSDWEFFCAIVEEMVADGSLVKALKKANGGAPVLCVRLPNDDPPDPVAASMKPSRMRPRKSTQNGAHNVDDDGESGAEGPSTVAKRPADDAPNGEPPLKRKRGRPRKEEVEARAAAAAAEGKLSKRDEPREPTPPWAAKRKAGVRLPSPPWVPKRIPTPPWTEGDKPGRPVTPPPPEMLNPTTLGKIEPSAQLEIAKGMIEQLEQRNENLIAGTQMLTAKDLKTLLPGNLPNSAVLDALNSMMMITTATLPRVHIGTTALYPAIIEALSDNSHGADPRVWTKVLKLQERINLFGLHRFIVPVNLKGRWTCACVDFKGTMISIYDSMPKPTETMQMTTIRALSTWLDHEAKARNHPPPDWKVWKADSAPRDVVKSESTADSGFYTWLFARNLIMQERIDMTFRMDIAGERIWLIVDGCQSLDHTPAGHARVSARLPPPGAPASPTHARRPSQHTPAPAPRLQQPRPPHENGNSARPARPPQLALPASQPHPEQQQPQAPSPLRTSPELQRRMSLSQASSTSTPTSRTTSPAPFQWIWALRKTLGTSGTQLSRFSQENSSSGGSASRPSLSNVLLEMYRHWFFAASPYSLKDGSVAVAPELAVQERAGAVVRSVVLLGHLTRK
ncbi:hypothetical protein AURDEDRAFT_153172 [Auricularia subglabra TFB-10046 SS5]|nr:hypothetical protein AURDEDRAFT_153172 [Auricularia subglabra TFB-10046 SS5]